LINGIGFASVKNKVTERLRSITDLKCSYEAVGGSGYEKNELGISNSKSKSAN